MAKNVDYRFRIGQDELTTLYNAAQARAKAHTEIADKYQAVIRECPYFESEKEALQSAIDLMKKEYSDFQIWAQIEKVEDIVRLKNLWIVTDDWKVKQAAEYLGLALMYDSTRLQNIVYDNVSIDNVVAYY